jgi:hypothetical protein
MSNRNLFILVSMLVLIIAGAFYIAYRQIAPEYDWMEKKWGQKGYSEKSDQPYGTMVFHRLLEHYFTGHNLTDLKTSVSAELPSDSTGRYSYVFIGEDMYLDSLSVRQLLNFVARGNTAMIISKNIPAKLMANLYDYDETCEESGWSDYATEEDSFARLSLANPRLQGSVSFHYAWQNKPRSYSWRYMDAGFFCDNINQQPLGYLNDSLVVFARFPYRSGQFLVHTNPIVFSNYSLLRPETHPYTEALLSWLPESNIYWDATSRIPEHNNEKSKENPLEYILKQPALAIAWYLLVGLAIVWLIFRGKRRQRIIPIIPQNENSSFEFITTIANLHFRDKNYRGLCIQSMKLFLAQIRERYNLIAPINPATGQPRIDDAFFKRLAAVSQVPESKIMDIFTQYNHTVHYEPTEQMMTDLYLSMEAFFKIAK